MSIATLDAKCSIRPFICAGQERFWQRATASPSGRKTSCPQDGHSFGSKYLDVPLGRLFTITFTISGMTSPARCIKTLSPMRISFRLISS